MPERGWLEGQFQAWIVAQAKAAGFRVHVTLKRLRKASVVADRDWPDLEMIRVTDRRHLYVEVKAFGRKVSEGQKEVLAALEFIHDGCHEVYVWDDPEKAPEILEILFGEAR